MQILRNESKSTKIKNSPGRNGVWFEEVEEAIKTWCILDILPHSNPVKYPKQYLIIVCIKQYCYVVPAKFMNDSIYLITVFPSRAATKKYLPSSNSK